MEILAYASAYLIIAMATGYIFARLTDDAYYAMFGILWPIAIPISLLIRLFDAIGELGERHAR